MNSHATAQSTKRYADRFRSLAAPGHFREAHGLTLSSLGIGTYLGQPDDKTDGTYAASVIAAVENGLNVIHTAVNYRFPRSERTIRKRNLPRYRAPISASGCARPSFICSQQQPQGKFNSTAWLPGTVSARKPRRGNPCSSRNSSNSPATLPAKHTISGSCRSLSISR